MSSEIKVSSLTAKAASLTTFTYAIDDVGGSWKLAVGGNNGLAYNNASGVLLGTSLLFGTTPSTGFAPLAAPTFTGVPAAPTAAPGTNTTQLATTGFVATSFAPLASPALTGVPTAPTAAVSTNTTQVATTAFVLANAGGVTFPLLAPNGTSGAPSYSFSTDSSLGFRYGTRSGVPYVVGNGGGSDVFRFSGSDARFEIFSGINFYMSAVPVYGDPTISVPTTGGTVDITNTQFLHTRVINPAGTLTALTVILEDGSQGGQEIRVAFTQIITSLTISGNTSTSGLAQPTSAAVNNSFVWIWSAGLGKWVRVE